MKSNITAFCVAASVLSSTLAFSATPNAPAMPLAAVASKAVAPDVATAGVTKNAKKTVKKHAAKKVIKKATMPS